MLKQRSRQSEKGDTIVEVLIAVAVVSLVLVSAYAITNRNTQSAQTAQEQDYAQKLVQQQVELLRSAPDRPKSGGCLGGNAEKLEEGNALCTKKIGGATYVLSIKQADDSSPFVVNAHWDTLNGSTADVSLYYRVK